MTRKHGFRIGQCILHKNDLVRVVSIVVDLYPLLLFPSGGEVHEVDS